MGIGRGDKDRRFAPAYKHKKQLKNNAGGFLQSFVNTVDEIVDKVTEGSIKLGIGSAKTLYGKR